MLDVESFFIVLIAIKICIFYNFIFRDNTQPPAPTGANYKMHTFDKPTECYVCGKLLR